MLHKTIYFVLAIALISIILIIDFAMVRRFAVNVSAIEPSQNIGVYRDFGCTNKVYAINWSAITAGQNKEISVYVRNEGSYSVILFVTAADWNPTVTPSYLKFSSYGGSGEVKVGEVVRVTLVLLVSINVQGIDNFSFNIVFEGKEYLLGDVNKDGNVDMRDIQIICQAFSSTPEDPNWNPDADVNKDYVVNMRDMGITTNQFGS